MKKLLIALFCAAMLVTPMLFTTGCTTTQPAAVNMTNVVRAAEIIRVVVRTGVLVDAIANTNHVPLIQQSINGLNQSLKMGTLTGGQLIVVVASLPIDKTTIQVVSGSLLIYDSLNVLFMTPDSQAVIFTIASAISAGAEEGLALAKTQAVTIPAPAVPTVVPAPTAENTKKF